jgi:hypothetical protein
VAKRDKPAEDWSGSGPGTLPRPWHLLVPDQGCTGQAGKV